MPEKSQNIKSPSGNLLEIIAHPIVVAVGVGVLAGYAARKAIISGNRSTFGFADKVDGGRVAYLAPKKDAQGNIVPDTTKEVSNGYLNRVLLAGGQVLLGTLLIGTSKEAELDLVGAGLAGGGIANLGMAILQIE